MGSVRIAARSHDRHESAAVNDDNRHTANSMAKLSPTA